MNTLAVEIPAPTLPERLDDAPVAPIVHRPPLQSGDRLTRLEFERRYSARTDIRKAELIEGVVVVYAPSPVHNRAHAVPHLQIAAWLGVYCAATPGVAASDNATLRLDLDNEMQPDASLWIETSGRTWEDADDFLNGAPELIVEIAASSAAYDLHDKLRAYRRNGVQEYLVLLTYERQVRWFNWQSEPSSQIASDEDGILRSQAFPGLWLHPDAFWQGEMARVLELLQRGLAADEHRQFAARLAAQVSQHAPPESASPPPADPQPLQPR